MSHKFDFLTNTKMDPQVMDPLRSGNTKPSLRSRSFQLTLNEIDKYDEVTGYLKGLKTLQYLISCKETAPSTGHEHIHIYAHFRESRNISIKKCCGAHVEICRGSPKQNIEYIMKDGNIIEEWGDVPHQGTSHTVKDLKELQQPDTLDWREYNTWLKIKNQPQKIKKSEWNKDVKIIYIYGESGIGKSTKAQELADDEFEEVKFSNGFWNGIVDGCGCCIYDDWRDSHMPASEFINFIDYRVHNMNVKGGNVKNKYTKVIITTIQSPYEIYKNCSNEFREQWLRRMEIISMLPNDCI